MKIFSKIDDYLADRPWIIAILLIFVFVVQPIDAQKINDQSVITELEKSYTQVTLSEKQVNWLYFMHGCPRDNSATYQFTAIANGQPVTGLACVRSFTHKVFVVLK